MNHAVEADEQSSSRLMPVPHPQFSSPDDSPTIDALCQVLARIVARVASPTISEPIEGLASEGVAR